MKQSMKINRILLGAFTGLLVLANTALAADVAGSWTWSTPGRNGGPDRVSKLTLKTDGGKLTGKLSAPGRDGAESETEISAGKVDGESVAFDVVRKTPNGDNTTHYHGKLAGDKIEGKVESERNGEKQSREWVAKRVTAAK